MKKFLDFVDLFSNQIKAKGFKKDGLYYRLIQFDNVAVIQIQKSMASTKEQVKFTLNVGIYFKNIVVFYNGEPNKKPAANDCQWMVRVGEILPIKQDYWWAIGEQSDLQAIANELIGVFNNVVYPALMNNISDELYMNNLWGDGISGSKNLSKLFNLAILFCIHKNEKLPIVLEELKTYYDRNPRHGSYENIAEKIESWKRKVSSNS